MIYLAMYDARVGVFEAAALTAPGARALLRRVYEDHERRHGRTPRFEDEDVNIRAIPAGGAWLDQQRIRE